MRRLIVGCIALLVLLAAAPAASARYYQLGSDLKAEPNIVEHHGADSAFWNVSLGSGGLANAPVGGQVTEVRVKGIVIPDPTGRRNPIPMIHFQTLHPHSDGTVEVELSSAPFYTPIGGDPNTISTYRPVNMCLHKGDVLDFNDIGGNEWWWGNYDGMPFLTFARTPNSSTAFYSKNNGTNIGSRWAPAHLKQGEELLMQMKFATGPDATDICPGGYKQHIFQGTNLRGGQEATLRSSTRTAKIRFRCPSTTYGGCAGTLRAEALLGGVRVPLGGTTFRAGPSFSGSVELPLTKNLFNRLKRAGKVTAFLTADSHDDPRHDKRVYHFRALPVERDDAIPVQHKTTRAKITLRSSD
ncbi:MAG TPA: hypothetical protein VJT75_09065 [Thermoleophilaceae bacterium]|nr:hypothetical protein [Thermoleophilaceae bacterium]